MALVGTEPWSLPTMSTRTARSQAERSSMLGPASAPIWSQVRACASSVPAAEDGGRDEVHQLAAGYPSDAIDARISGSSPVLV
jgi:hypothetical protein